MGVALKLYEQLTDAGEDKARARLIAEAFEELESRYPEIKELATQGHVRESELRLQKEIEVVRKEIKDVEVRLTSAIHRQTIWVITAAGSIVGLLKMIDYFLK